MGLRYNIFMLLLICFSNAEEFNDFQSAYPGAVNPLHKIPAPRPAPSFIRRLDASSTTVLPPVAVMETVGQDLPAEDPAPALKTVEPARPLPVSTKQHHFGERKYVGYTGFQHTPEQYSSSQVPARLTPAPFVPSATPGPHPAAQVPITPRPLSSNNSRFFWPWSRPSVVSSKPLPPTTAPTVDSGYSIVTSTPSPPAINIEEKVEMQTEPASASPALIEPVVDEIHPELEPETDHRGDTPPETLSVDESNPLEEEAATQDNVSPMPIQEIPHPMTPLTELETLTQASVLATEEIPPAPAEGAPATPMEEDESLTPLTEVGSLAPVAVEVTSAPLEKDELLAPIIEEESPSTPEKEELPATIIEKEESPLTIIENESPVPSENEELPEPIIEKESPAPVEKEELPEPIIEKESPAPVEKEQLPEPIIEKESPAPLEKEELPAPLEREDLPALILEEGSLAPIEEQKAPTPMIEEESAEPIIEDASPSTPRPMMITPPTSWNPISKGSQTTNLLPLASTPNPYGKSLIQPEDTEADMKVIDTTNPLPSKNKADMGKSILLSPPKYPMSKPTPKPTPKSTVERMAIRPFPRPNVLEHSSGTAGPITVSNVALYQGPGDITCEIQDFYYAIQNECEGFIECKHGYASRYICPDGLYFNPKAAWPAYPCAYPYEVQCIGRSILHEPVSSAECPRQYGYFAIDGSDCSKYKMCQEGRALYMDCPPGLAFNPEKESCDWPVNVPSCNPKVFQGFECPNLSDIEEDDRILTFKHNNSCREYVACQQGRPRLLRCDDGYAFDEDVGFCIEEDYVDGCH